MKLITPKDVNRLREQTGAGFDACWKALRLCEGDHELAVEQVTRTGLAAKMSPQARYPKWHAKHGKAP